MRFWSQKLMEPIHSPIQRAPGVSGHLPCSGDGCDRQDAAQCAYVDNRGRSCYTAWCVDHQHRVAGGCFCRRHATLPLALNKGEFLADRGYPDTANRAPSLVNHVGDLVEPRLFTLLEHLRKQGERISGEGVRVIRVAGSGRRWQRSWQIYDHTGVTVRVAVEVDEATDPIVDVRVGRRLVASETPPWIARRQMGVSPGDTVSDDEEKAGFAALLYDSLESQTIADARFRYRAASA